ncbi:hypothetical protein PR202_gb13278 [Eleusine coracana subsp. coracana]|uniref:Uncharacterized protein n=1 Tax=Eleusine coracana subsp. coracana TaxID=191504 RepID=A0AAV5ES97_ELECO|nr:hypothetical protein PR202_gb13278 [Eleusine coracana subsp. coracana]
METTIKPMSCTASMKPMGWASQPRSEGRTMGMVGATAALRRRLPPHPPPRAHHRCRRRGLRRHRGPRAAPRSLLHGAHGRHRGRLHPTGHHCRACPLPHRRLPPAGSLHAPAILLSSFEWRAVVRVP